MLPQQYIITEAIIRSNRVDFETDIARNIIDFNIYESINKPYTTAAMTILDDNSLMETLDFRGTEFLDLKIEIKDTGYILEHTFIMNGIKKTLPTNDKSSILLIHLMDVHAFNDTLKKVSKSYTGKIEDIITRILQDYLQMDVDLSYMEGFPSLQESIRVIPPYLSPLQACMWLKARATTVNGSPFYLCTSVFNNFMRLGNFDSMMTRPIFNSELPFIYSSTQTNLKTEFWDIQNAFVVQRLKRQNDHNSFDMIQQGGLTANVKSNDIQGGKTINYQYKLRDQLQRLQDQGIIPKSKQTIFDDKSKHDEEKAKEVSVFTCSKTFKDFNSIHDADDPAKVISNIQSAAITSALERNKLMISIPGLTIFGKKVSVGDRLRLNILDTNMERSGDVDRVRSGDYLILESRHIYMDTEFRVNLTVSKVNALDE